MALVEKIFGVMCLHSMSTSKQLHKISNNQPLIDILVKHFNFSNNIPWYIFLFAFCIRLIYVVSLPMYNLGPWDADSLKYIKMAQNLVQFGNLYPILDSQSKFIVSDPPMYSVFLSPLFLFSHIEEPNFLVVRVTQALLGGLTAFFIADMVARTTRNKFYSLLAGGLVTFQPALIAHTGTLMTETLYTFLVVLSIWYLTKSNTTLKLKQAITAGTLLAITALTREPILLFIPLALFVLIFMHRFSRKALIFSSVSFISCMCVVGFWTLRNYNQVRHFAVVTSHAPQFFYLSQHIPPDREWELDAEHINDRYATIAMDLNTPWITLGIKELCKNLINRPLSVLKMWYGKLQELCLHPSGLYQLKSKPIVYKGYFLSHVFLLIMCILGIIYCIKRRIENLLLPGFYLIYTILVHVFIVWPLARYFVPALPFVCLFAGIYCAKTIEFFKMHIQQRS